MPRTSGKPLLLAAAAALAPITLPAAGLAGMAWQPPVVQQCTLGPGEDCNVEASCPAELPWIVAGGGGMPKAPTDHRVAMTMNLPISKNAWRVRWRNMAETGSAEVKVAVRIKCSDDAAAAGW